MNVRLKRRKHNRLKPEPSERGMKRAKNKKVHLAFALTQYYIHSRFAAIQIKSTSASRSQFHFKIIPIFFSPEHTFYIFFTFSLPCSLTFRHQAVKRNEK